MISLQKYNSPHESQIDDISEAKLCVVFTFCSMVENMLAQASKKGVLFMQKDGSRKLASEYRVIDFDEIEVSKHSSKLMGFLEDTFIKRGAIFGNLVQVYAKNNLPGCDLRVKNFKRLSTVQEVIKALKSGLPVAFGMKGYISTSGVEGKPETMVHKFKPSVNPVKNGHMVMIDTWNDKEKYFEAENWNPNFQRLRIYEKDFKPQSLFTFEISST